MSAAKVAERCALKPKPGKLEAENTLAYACERAAKMRERAERLAPRVRSIATAQRACFKAENDVAGLLFCAAWPALRAMAAWPNVSSKFGNWSGTELYMVDDDEPHLEVYRKDVLRPMSIRGRKAIIKHLNRYILSDVIEQIERILDLGERETTDEDSPAFWERDRSAVLALKARLSGSEVDRG